MFVRERGREKGQQEKESSTHHTMFECLSLGYSFHMSRVVGLTVHLQDSCYLLGRKDCKYEKGLKNIVHFLLCVRWTSNLFLVARDER